MKYLFNISVASGNNLIKSLLLLKKNVSLSKYIDISHWQRLKKLMLFSAVLICIISEVQAENSFQLTYSTTTINRGDQSGSTVTLTITNSNGALSSGSYSLVTTTGIYMSNPVITSNTLGSSTVGINTNQDTLTIHVNPQSTINSLTITFTLVAGQCFNVTTLDKFLVAPFSSLINITNGIINPVTVPSNNLINNQLTVEKGAYLDYEKTYSILTAFPDQNNAVAFKYYLLNDSGYPFDNAVLSFEESNVSSAFNITSIIVHKKIKDSQTWDLIGTINKGSSDNSNSFVTAKPLIFDQMSDPLNSGSWTSITINPGDSIRFEEQVTIIGCLSSGSITNNSSPIIRWGNFNSADLCGSPQDILSAVINTSNSPNLVVQGDTSNLACFNDLPSGGRIKSVKIYNNGTAPAYGVKIQLNNNSGGPTPINIPIISPYNAENNPDIKVKLLKNDKTIIPGAINFQSYLLDYTKTYSNSSSNSNSTLPYPGFIPQSAIDFYSTQNPNGISGYQLYNSGAVYVWSSSKFLINGFISINEYYNNVTSGSTISSYPYSSSCIGGFNTKLIENLIVDSVDFTGDGNFLPITLQPGDTIQLFWKEYNCSFKNEVMITDINAPTVSATYNSLCTTQPVIGYSNSDKMELSFNPSPSPPTAAGDVDQCNLTSDGQVIRISSEILSNFINPPNSYYYSNAGQIVFRIYLQDGLDLDKALAKPQSWGRVLNLGLNNLIDEPSYIDPLPSCNPCSSGNTTVCNPSTLSAGSYYVTLTNSTGSLSLVPAEISLKYSDGNNVQGNGESFSSFWQRVQNNNRYGNLIFEDSSLYANFLYEATFNISDIIQSEAPSPNSIVSEYDYHTYIDNFLANSKLNFDLRTYCKGLSNPNYKVIMYYSLCPSASQVDVINNSADPTPGYVNMQPLSDFNGNISINCPGCAIPGANIEIATLYRKNRGLVDLDGDRIPDNPTLDNPRDTVSWYSSSSLLATMGDTLVTFFNCDMSNGTVVMEDQLPNPLNNVYIEVSLQDDNQDAIYNTNYEVSSIVASYNGISITLSDGVEILTDPKQKESFIIHISVNSFNTSSTNISKKNYNDFNSGGISFTIQYVLGNIATSLKTLDVSYTPYFSPYNIDLDSPSPSSIDLTSMTIIPPSGINPATGAPFTTNELGNQTFWKCTGFSNSFQFIPYEQSVVGGYSYQNNCQKMPQVVFSGKFFKPNGQTTDDVFFNEYRTFLSSPLETQIPIPTGYVVDSIQVYSLLYKGIAGYYDTYSITNTVANNNYLNSFISNNNGNKSFPSIVNLTVTTKAVQSESDLNSFISNGNGSFVLNHYGENLGSLLIGDEFYAITVSLFISTDNTVNCSSIPDYQINADYRASNYNPLYNFMSNIPPDQDKGNPGTNDTLYNPYVQLQPLSTKYGYKIPKTYGYDATLYAPQAKLKLKSLEQTAFEIDLNHSEIINSETYIRIPILISNLETPDGVTFNAYYPYLMVSGLAMQEGLSLDSLYAINDQYIIANHNFLDPATNSPYYYNIQSTTKDTVVVGITNYPINQSYYTPQIDVNNSVQPMEYMLVFKYTPPLNCQSNIGCGSSSSNLPNCLNPGGSANLSVKAGWNCNGFPSIADIKNGNLCGATPDSLSLLYTIGIQATGLTVSTFLTNNAGEKNMLSKASSSQMVIVPNTNTMNLDLCQIDQYTVRLKSCQNGTLSAFDIALSNLPANVNVSLATSSISYFLSDGSTIAGTFTATPDTKNPFLYHLDCSNCDFSNNDSVDVVFNVVSPCSIPDGSLTTTISALAIGNNSPVQYQQITTPYTSLAAVSPVLLDNITVASTSISASGTELMINYAVAGAGASGVTVYDDTLLIAITGTVGSTFSTSFKIGIPIGTANGSYSYSYALSVQCATYSVSVSPYLGYAPACGIQSGTVQPACEKMIAGTSVTNNSVVATVSIPVGLTTATGQASFICSNPGTASESTVAFVATAGATGPYTYTWSVETTANSGVYTTLVTDQNVSGSDTYTTGVPGNYMVTVTNTEGCSGSATGSAVSQVAITCPDNICPGTNPPISVTTAGIIGSYATQWYQHPAGAPADLSGDILQTGGILNTGEYYAVAITPSCTLTTSYQMCDINVLAAPQAYSLDVLSPDQTVNYGTSVGFCSGSKALIHVINPTVNAAMNPSITWTGIQSNTGKSDLSDYLTSTAGSYSIIATDNQTGCSTSSNAVQLYNPSIWIEYDGSTDCNNMVLSAISNFVTASTDYTWLQDNKPYFIGSTVTIPPSDFGHQYTVSLPVDLCNAKTGINIPASLANTGGSGSTTGGGSSATNLIPDGDFEGGATCPPSTFSSGLNCLLSGAVLTNEKLILTNDPNGNNLFTVGGYFIDNSTVQNSIDPNKQGAHIYNQGWSETAYSGTSFMIVDGDASAPDKVLWEKSGIQVNQGYRYFFKAHVSNIDIANQYPVRALPEIFITINFTDPANATGGVNTALLSYQTITSSPSGPNQWITISGYVLANAFTGQSGLTMGDVINADIQISMNNAGALGNDVGIDDIELWSLGSMGSCTNPTQIVTSPESGINGAWGASVRSASNTSDITPCELTDIPSANLEICPGQNTASFYISGYNSSLSNNWYAVSGGTNVLLSPQPTVTNNTVTFTLPASGSSFEFIYSVSNATCSKQILLYVSRPNILLNIVPVVKPGVCGLTYQADLQGSVIYPGIQYQWIVNGRVVSTTTASSITLTTLKNGDAVSCTVSNVFCGPVSSNKITVSGLPAVIAKNQTVCSGASAQIGTTSVAGDTYSWSPTQFLSNPAIANPVIVTPMATNPATLTYILTVTDANGCIRYDTVNVLVNPAPPAPIAPAMINYCQNDIASALTATGTNLLWYAQPQGGVGISNAQIPFTGTPGSSNFFVSQTINGCESPRAMIQVVVNPLPAPGVILVTPSTPVCSGTLINVGVHYGPDQLVSFTEPVLTNKSGGSTTGGFGFSGNATTSGSFVLVKQNVFGCKATTTVPLVVNPLPAAPVTSKTLSYCQNDVTKTLIATGTDLLWYSTPTGGTGSTAAPLPSSAVAGIFTYYVSQTDPGNQCESLRDTIQVTINPLPTPGIITVTPSGPVCAGTEMVVSVTFRPDEYVSFNQPPFTNQYGSGTPSGFAFSGDATISSSFVLVKQNTFGCQATTSVPLVVNPLPSAPVTAKALSYCQNAIAKPLTAIGTNLLWYTTATGGTGSTDAPVPSTAVVGTFSYYVSQTVPGNPCESLRDTIQVTVNPQPSAPVTAKTLAYCQNAIAKPLIATGTNLLWYAQPIGGKGSTTAPLPSTAVAGTFTYYVSQTDPAGQCESLKDTIQVTVVPIPGVPVVISPANRCLHDVPKPLTATGTNLLWYNTPTGGIGMTTAPAPATNVLTIYNYYVSQTSVLANCESPRAHIAVTINPVPLAPQATVNTHTVCAPGNISVTLHRVSGISYTYTTPSGSGTFPSGFTRVIEPITVGNTSGNVIVTATNSFKCSASTTSAITINPLPSTFGFSVTPTTLCQGSELTVSVLTQKGTSNISYYAPAPVGSTLVKSSDNQSGFGYSVLISPTATNFVMTATATNSVTGCAISESKAITVNANPIVGISVSPASSVCMGTNVVLNGSGASSYSWTQGISNGVPFVPTKTTSYTVTGTGTDGCIGTATKTITVDLGKTSPKVTLPPSLTVCASPFGEKVHLNPSVNGGVVPYTYLWTPSAELSSATILNPVITVRGNQNQTYSLLVTDHHGCMNESFSEIIINPACRLSFNQSADTAVTSIVPNPSSTDFKLTAYSDAQSEVSVYIYDMNGRLIQEATVPTNQSFFFGSEYSSGMYAVKIVFDNDNSKTIKVVKIN